MLRIWGAAPNPEVYRFGFQGGNEKETVRNTLPPRKPVRALGSLLSVALSSLTVKRKTLYHKKVDLNYSL